MLNLNFPLLEQPLPLEKATFLIVENGSTSTVNPMN